MHWLRMLPYGSNLKSAYLHPKPHPPSYGNCWLCRGKKTFPQYVGNGFQPLKIPLRPMCDRKKFFLLRNTSLNRGIQWTKRDSDGLGLMIPLTEGRYDLVMYCSQSLAHYGGLFWKEIVRGRRSFFVEKFKSVRRDPIFLLWEFLPNMPGMQVSKCSYFLLRSYTRSV